MRTPQTFRNFHRPSNYLGNSLREFSSVVDEAPDLVAMA